MTGITGHARLTVEVRAIEVQDHLDHLAPGQLRLLLVAFPDPVIAAFSVLAVLDVAVVAGDCERSRDEVHHRKELGFRHSLEHLNVLAALFDWWITWRQIGRAHA